MSNIEPAAGEEFASTRDDDDEMPARVREGLPSTYRMRADAHYVDLLTSRPSAGRERMLAPHDIEAAPVSDAADIRPLVDSIARHGVLQPLLIQHRHGKHRLIAGHKRLSAAIAAGITEIPCRLYDVNDEEAARLAGAASLGMADRSTVAPRSTPRADAGLHAGADLEKALASLTACADFVSGSDSELSRTVAGTLLRAEVWRTTCLLKATRVLRHEFPVIRATLPVRKLIDSVVAGFSAERRLRLIEFEVRSTLSPDAVIVSDERILSIAIASAIRSLLAAFGEGGGATVKIAVAAQSTDLVAFTVSQNQAAVPDAFLSRAFDAEWIDRPGGQATMVSMLAIKEAAEMLGGSARTAPAGRGAAIELAVPAGI